MIFCPILFYGGAQEHDIDFDQFSILFRSIFLEGLARPLAGIQRDPEDAGPAVQGARRRAAAAGGRASGSSSRTGAVEKVVLEDGSELEARNVLSSAGWAETMRLCDDGRADDEPPAGRHVGRRVDLDPRPPSRARWATTRRSSSTTIRRSSTTRSPTIWSICGAGRSARRTISPIAEPLRRRRDARFRRWPTTTAGRRSMPTPTAQAKLRWYDRLAASAVRFVPDFRRAVVETDMFTPLTIQPFHGPRRRRRSTAPPANAATAPRT